MPILKTCIRGFVFKLGHADLVSNMKPVLKAWYVFVCVLFVVPLLAAAAACTRILVGADS